MDNPSTWTIHTVRTTNRQPKTTTAMATQGPSTTISKCSMTWFYLIQRSQLRRMPLFPSTRSTSIPQSATLIDHAAIDLVAPRTSKPGHQDTLRPMHNPNGRTTNIRTPLPSITYLMNNRDITEPTLRLSESRAMPDQSSSNNEQPVTRTRIGQCECSGCKYGLPARI